MLTDYHAPFTDQRQANFILRKIYQRKEVAMVKYLVLIIEKLYRATIVDSF